MKNYFKIILVSIYPSDSFGQYLLSSYLLKAYLEKFYKGKIRLDITVINFSVKNNISEISEIILKHNPDCIGYSSYVWNIEQIIEIIGKLKAKNNYIHVLGGPEISIERIKLFNNIGSDYYVIGEGERKFANLVEYIANKNNDQLVDVPKGIAYWDNGNLIYQEDSNKITNLDEIPSIYLNRVIEDELYEGKQAFIETQRGCQYRCKYCVYHKSRPSICYYSLDRIYEELDYLITQKRILALRIFDAIFTSDIERAKKIVEFLLELKKRPDVRIPFIYWEFIYSDIEEDFLKLIASLKQAEKILNVNNIHPLDIPQHYSEMLKNYTIINCTGIQSFHGPSLKAVSRPKVEIGKINKFMALAKKHNIVLKIDIILGLPFETLETYFNGLELFLPFFKDTDHILNIHRLQILPGSTLEKICSKYNIKYSEHAPHEVLITNSLTENEINYLSKLTAVLFRILNSPLRKYFFEAKENTGKSFFWLIQNIYNKIIESKEFENTQLVKNHSSYDDYWNNEIFKDITSKWLIKSLKSTW